MEALVKYEKGPGHVRLQDMPMPVPADNQVLLEVDCCGICGTDLHVYHDTFRNYPPVILGHEFWERWWSVASMRKWYQMEHPSRFLAL